jgi:hypothetical protein
VPANGQELKCASASSNGPDHWQHGEGGGGGGGAAWWPSPAAPSLLEVSLTLLPSPSSFLVSSGNRVKQYTGARSMSFCSVTLVVMSCCCALFIAGRGKRVSTQPITIPLLHAPYLHNGQHLRSDVSSQRSKHTPQKLWRCVPLQSMGLRRMP